VIDSLDAGIPESEFVYEHRDRVLQPTSVRALVGDRSLHDEGPLGLQEGNTAAEGAPPSVGGQAEREVERAYALDPAVENGGNPTKYTGPMNARTSPLVTFACSRIAWQLLLRRDVGLGDGDASQAADRARASSSS
jgi:hypothetical protein